jgi:hypothetical protein
MATVAPPIPRFDEPRPSTVTALWASMACGLVAAAVQAAIVVPFLGRYGWDRDELYFLSAARRPALGYVDFPPLTAWIGWVVHAVAGNSLVALRVTSLVEMMVSVVLVALMARELGGGLVEQTAAAFVWALSPYGLGAASIFHPTWLDELCWVALLYVVLLVFTRGRPGLWLVAGVIAGVGLEAKYTIAVLLVGLTAAMLLCDQRSMLRVRWPWLGAVIAFGLASPNLAWQAAHGWPSAHFMQSQQAATAASTPPATYVAEQLFLGAGVVLVVIGVVALWRRRDLRPFAIVPVLITVIFLVERGRAYYPLPADSIAVAAGTIALARWVRSGGRRRLLGAVAPLVALQAAVYALALPIVLPVLSTSSMIRKGVWQQSFYKDEIGWPELAGQTARAWRALTPDQRADGAIVAQNYGEASALDLYGPSRRLPPPLSGHLSWQYWRPQQLPQRFVLFIGYPPTELSRLCRSWHTDARIDNHWHLNNEERGRIIATCRLRHPLGSIWSTDIATDNL